MTETFYNDLTNSYMEATAASFCTAAIPCLPLQVTPTFNIEPFNKVEKIYLNQ